jgi:DNA polymerase II large subunit
MVAKRISLEEYSSRLTAECNKVYDLINAAKAKGFDPKTEIEIPQAIDLAERTQKLLKFLWDRNTAAQIRELTQAHDGNRELVALDIARIVCAESYLYGVKNNCEVCNGKGTIPRGRNFEISCDDCGGAGYVLGYTDQVHQPYADTIEQYEKEVVGSSGYDKVRAALCMYHGICAGLAVLTEGILVAPLEGVVSCRIIANADGSNCLAVNYAGPIRSAGGTGQALSALIADILRRDFSLGVPQLTFSEVERYKEEVSLYRGLQYRPSNPELEIIANACPIFVDGEGVGKEVTGQRDLERVRDNKVREGALLVMCEGLVLKAPKILKYVDQLGLDGWDWLKKFLKTSKDSGEIKPNPKFMAEVLAGRPIFSMPMAEGGFRLRYGRSRLAGLATTSCHPATMMATSGFVSIGTQLKYERPGKGTVVTPCHDIQGPYIQFNDGSAKRIQSRGDMELMLPNEVGYEVSKVWDLGELLVPVGEFLENNHPLLPSPYVSEWHRELLANRGITPAKDFMEAVQQCQIYQVPLDPRYVATGWTDVSAQEVYDLMKAATVSLCGGLVSIPESHRETVYRLNIDIDANGNLKGDESYVILNNLTKLGLRINLDIYEHGLDYLNSICEYEVRPRTTYRIGARMGKPEGSKMRDMKPSRAHGLFPVGDNGGVQKLINNALEKEGKVGVSKRFCGICDEETHWPVCRGIGDKSHDPEPTRFHEKQWVALDYKGMWDQALQRCQMEGEAPPKVKGVKGLRNNEMLMEPLDKALLRAKHGVSVFRDGTIRFDMVDITMTHFKPSEIGMTLEQAHELGYLVDSVDEVVEIFPQDVVIPDNCAEDLVNVCKFTDDELEFIYEQPRYYGVEKPEDLIGQMIMGIAPHTSGAILGRIIGFTSVKGHYGHPFYHAAKRRNCDGDIDAIIMLTEGLLNFSRQFLPRSRGGQMDAPLILTMGINASEIDKEALNVETCWKYPEAFFELTQGYTEDGKWRPAQAKESTQFVEIVEARLGTDQEAVGFGYTHGTDNANDGPEWNPYNDKEMNLSMRQKTMAQFALGEVLHAVDNERQSAKLIDTHLIRDMRGNLRAFGQQKIRCTKCGRSYRRVPISGKCMEVTGTKTDPFSGETVEIKCPGNLVMTVSQGAVSKYDELMRDIIEIYGCDEYISQLYSSVSMWVAQTFEDRSVGSQQRLW